MNPNLVSFGLPIASAVVLILALVVRDGVKPGDTKKPDPPAGAFIVMALLVGVLTLGLTRIQATTGEALSAGYGMAIGLATAVIAYWLGTLKGQAEAGRAAPIALATAIVSVVPLIPGSAPPTAVLFGAAVGAWMLSIGKSNDPNPWAVRVAAIMGAIIAADMIGAQLASGPNSAYVGSVLAFVAALAGVISAAAPAAFRGIGAAVLLAGAGFLVGDKLLEHHQTPIVAAGAALLALIVSWLIPDDSEPNTVRLSIAVVLWVSAGSAALSNGGPVSMAMLLVCGTAILLLTGNWRALLTLGPLAAIVFYRLFRTEHIEATRAFDIGQHYAMIGLVVGAALPVMAQEWLRSVSKRGGFLALIAGVAWIVTMLGLPIAAALMFGAKGVVGYLFGLGLAAFIECVRGERSAHALSLGIGLSGVMTLVYGSLQTHLEMTRDEKTSMLAWVIGGVIVAALTIAVLSGDWAKPKKEEPATTA